MSGGRGQMLPIGNARAAGERLGLRSLIVLQELPDGRWGYTSWGKTKADCDRAKRIADDALETAMDSANGGFGGGVMQGGEYD